MNTNFSINENNPSFGMALHMPSKARIARKLGRYCADQAEIIRPTLERMAKDVDIYVKPEPCKEVDYKGFSIVVKGLEKNILKKWFCVRPYSSSDIHMYNIKKDENLWSELLKKVEATKARYIKYSR